MTTLEQVEQLQAVNQKLSAEVAALKSEIKLLSEKIQYLLKQLFGSKSEKIDPNQLTLLLDVQTQMVAAEEALQEAEEVLSARPRAKRRPLADRLPADLPVETNLRYFARVVGAAPADVMRVIDEVSLGDVRRRLVRDMSGGQQARVSLAVALLGSPELLVLDEPTVGLDPVLRKELWTLFAALAAEGRTLLVSSHVMDEAERCDALILMRGGRVIAHDAPATLLARTDTVRMDDAFLALIERGDRDV